jgi:hypothetical protein
VTRYAAILAAIFAAKEPSHGFFVDGESAEVIL